MKISHNSFEKIICLENLFEAWDEFKIGKRNKLDVQQFERHLEDNIFQLHQSLENKTYKHSPYKSFYIFDPKVRHIHKAIVKDRILHHALFRQIYAIFDKTFISDSYSCRKEKGIHKAVDRFQKFGRKATQNNTRNVFVLKCDVKKFFATIDHNVLKNLIEIKIKDKDAIWLINEIIDSFYSEFTKTFNEKKGAPIGNLTSQLFANIYLNKLDQFLKQTLKVKYYIRYTDDFVILDHREVELKNIIEPIQNFLKQKLKLNLHPNKTVIRKYRQGIDFLGYISFPYCRFPRVKTLQRILRKTEENIKQAKQGKITVKSLDNSLQSYFGFLKHCDSYNIQQDLKNQIWVWLQEKTNNKE